LNESHVQPLPQDLKEELLAKHVLLCFAVSSEGACARLKKYLINEVGFSEDRLDVISERDLPLQKRVFAGGDSEFQHNDKVALRDFVQSIGERIFISEGKSPDVARRRALGDGDAQAMVVFPYNCPTMTVPALWLTGLVAGVEWVPLIPRGRRYHPDSGQFVGEDA
jgi:hypothetical protein